MAGSPARAKISALGLVEMQSSILLCLKTLAQGLCHLFQGRVCASKFNAAARRRLQRLAHKSLRPVSALPQTNNILFIHGKPTETASCWKNILHNVTNDSNHEHVGLWMLTAAIMCFHNGFAPLDEDRNDLCNLAAVPVLQSVGKHSVYPSNNGNSSGTYFTTKRCDVHDTMPAHREKKKHIYVLFPPAHTCTRR